MIADWREGLAGLSDEQIKQGAKRLPKKWPPQVDVFYDLCVGNSTNDDWQHQSAAYQLKDSTKKLVKKADREKGLNEMQKAREILKGGASPREKARRDVDARRLLFGGE